MDFTFTEEQNMLRETARKFAEAELKPRAAQIDKEKTVPKELLDKAAELGFFGVPFPEKYAGSGMGELGYCILMEELSKGCASTAITIGVSISIGATPIYVFGTEEQKQKYLIPLNQGKMIGAFSLTEAGAGSDASAMRTTATEDGDYYVLNGEKIYVSNGGIADVITTFALTDKTAGVRGITSFIVETKTPGFKVARLEEKMGIRGSTTAVIQLDNVRVPKANVLGKLGDGFKVAMRTLDTGRLGIGAGSIGMSKEVLNLATKHANERVQFGRPIAEQEAIQWMLADMAAGIYAMESMVYRTAWVADQGSTNFTRESAITKMFCSEVADDIIDKALQIHGGMGYMTDYPLERFYRDARISRIYEGTNEIQRLVIARDIIKKGGY